MTLPNEARKVEMTEQEIQDATEEINNMSRLDMCRLWRFAPAGHRFFNTTLPLHEIFKKRFDELGGFSPEISKQIGLG